MTFRGVIAIVLGLLAAAILAAITHFNDWVIKSTFLIGNFLPVSVFGGLVIFLLLINLPLFLIWRRLGFSARQLAVVVALMFFACCIPGSSLLRYFTATLMMPHHHERTNPGWQGAAAQIDTEDVNDWPALIDALGRANRGDQADPAPTHVCLQALDRLSSDDRAAVAGMTRDTRPGKELQDSIVEALNGLVDGPKLPLADKLDGPAVSRPVRFLLAKAPDELSTAERARLNRGLIDAALPGIIDPRAAGVLENIPNYMLADPGDDTTRTVDGFYSGLAEGDKLIHPINDVPWASWKRTLIFWVPLILTMSLVVIGLALVVHQQWAHHEHLPYPTVEFARSLLPEEGRAVSSIFSNRLFWLGLVPVVLIYMNNYAHQWFPETVIPVRTRLDLYSLLGIFPIFMKTWMCWLLFAPTIYFMVIGFTYFLAKDVALSIGISPFVYSLLLGYLMKYGVSMSGGGLAPSPNSFMHAGIYFGLFVGLLYTGRRYYLSVFRRSLLLPCGDRVESYAVAGARVFILAGAAVIVQLVFIGLDWQLAFLFVGITLVMFVVLSRLLAEAGYFFVGLTFFPWTLMLGFMGAKALGSDQLLLMMLLSTILIVPRETLMPFAVSALCLADKARARVGSTAAWGAVAITVALVVGLPIVLYLQYWQGASASGDWWGNGHKPQEAFRSSIQYRQALEAQGTLEEANALSGWKRFLKITPDKRCLVAFSIAFTVVLVFMFMRHRFPKWPFHPLMLLTMGMWSINTFAFSILLGWAIKTAVTKYGGARLYQKLKPLMIGLIAGELLGILIPVIVGAIYYLATGDQPKVFHVLPR
ncbi:MAG: hypothetical protein HQ592_11245 [Planctomycetes bacterium]|nr:hypothetical protein [Planctomycetota bacterium]